MGQPTSSTGKMLALCSQAEVDYKEVVDEHGKCQGDAGSGMASTSSHAGTTGGAEAAKTLFTLVYRLERVREIDGRECSGFCSCGARLSHLCTGWRQPSPRS